MPAKLRVDLHGEPRPCVDAAGRLGSRPRGGNCTGGAPRAADRSASQFMNRAKRCRNRCCWVFWVLRRFGGRPSDSNMVIRRAEMLGCGVRRYAGRMACLLPQHMALEEFGMHLKASAYGAEVSRHITGPGLEKFSAETSMPLRHDSERAAFA